MDSDIQPATPSRRGSSVLYALGKLSAEVSQASRAVADVPAQVVATIAPELRALRVDVDDHSKRLTAVEHHQWVWMGGTGVVVTIALALLGGETLHFHF